MSEITGSVKVTGIITPTDTTDVYAVTDPIYGREGLRNVSSVAEMLAIPPDRRRLGMVVGVGVSGTSGTYYNLINEPGTPTTLTLSTLGSYTVESNGTGWMVE